MPRPDLGCSATDDDDYYYCPRQFSWRLYSTVVVTLVWLVTACFMQRDGKAGLTTSALKMVAVCSSETLESTYRSIRRCYPVDQHQKMSVG
jgi:hypothetical protein